MKTNVKSIAACLLAVFCLASCADQVGEEVISDRSPVDIPAHVLRKFQKLGVCSENIIPQGENYLVEGDIVVTPAALADMEEFVSVPGPLGEEQYRTCNLVNCGKDRTINIRSYLTSVVMNVGLDYAIANLNRLDLCLTFQKITRGPADITIYPYTGNGGFAGFPSGGNPYPYVYMGSELANYGVDVSEHVATHEIGHCLGMRHTDYFDTSYSCGSGGNEGGGSYCAVWISGTPIGHDANSLFNACFTLSTDGELSLYDSNALKALY